MKIEEFEELVKQMYKPKPPFRGYSVNQYWSGVYFEEVCFLTNTQLYTKLLECFEWTTRRNPFIKELKTSDAILHMYTRDVFVRWFYTYFQHIRWKMKWPLFTHEDKTRVAEFYRMKIREMLDRMNHYINFNFNMDREWTVARIVFEVKDTYKDFNRG